MNEHAIITRHLGRLALEGYAPTTITERRRKLGQLARALPVPLLEATPVHLMAWRESFQLSRGAIGNYVGHARKFYAWAITEGLITDNPAAALPVPRPARRIPRPISEAELMAVLAAAPRRVRLWIVLAAWAGLRACEIAGLRSENIRLGRAPCIFITPEATKGNSERIVQLCDFAVSEIHAARLPRRGWAFLRADGLPGPNTPHRVSVLANTLLRECGVPDTFHGLRHRCLTQLYNATLDLRLVQEFAGHRRPETTAVYTKVADGKALAAVQLLPVPARLRAAV